MDQVEDKRASILSATLKLVSENGFHGTVMSKVAKAAGVSSGIIYHYFDSKDGLILELYKEIKYRMIRVVVDDYSEEIPYWERFHLWWHRLVYFYINHPQEAKFLEQFENSPYNTPNFQEIFRSELMPFITSFFVQGIQDGVLKNIPLEISTELSFGVAISLAKQHIRGVLKLNDEMIDIAASASWDALKK